MDNSWQRQAPFPLKTKGASNPGACMLWWHSSQQGSAPEESRHQEIMCNTFNWFTALCLCKPTVSSSYFTASSSSKPFKGFFSSSQYAYKVERKSTKNHELKGRHNFKKENAHNPIRKRSLICPLEENSPSQSTKILKGGLVRALGSGSPLEPMGDFS